MQRTSGLAVPRPHLIPNFQSKFIPSQYMPLVHVPALFFGWNAFPLLFTVNLKDLY